MRYFHLVSCCSVLMVAGCTSQPKTTGGLDLPLQPGQNAGTLVYRAPDVDPRKYKAIFVENADIYRAADADFGSASEQDKAQLAQKLSTEFRNALTKHRYHLVTEPGPGVVRLHLILAGVKESKPVAATVLRLTPLGLGMSAAKTATGGNQALVGSATVSGEMFDSESGEALAGFVATESPIAIDLTSGLGKLRAAELGIERGSEDFASSLDRYLNRNPANM